VYIFVCALGIRALVVAYSTLWLVDLLTDNLSWCRFPLMPDASTSGLLSARGEPSSSNMFSRAHVHAHDIAPSLSSLSDIEAAAAASTVMPLATPRSTLAFPKISVVGLDEDLP
jgi:hypothetical protein